MYINQARILGVAGTVDPSTRITLRYYIFFPILPCFALGTLHQISSRIVNGSSRLSSLLDVALFTTRATLPVKITFENKMSSKQNDSPSQVQRTSSLSVPSFHHRPASSSDLPSKLPRLQGHNCAQKDRSLISPGRTPADGRHVSTTASAERGQLSLMDRGLVPVALRSRRRQCSLVVQPKRSQFSMGPQYSQREISVPQPPRRHIPKITTFQKRVVFQPGDSAQSQASSVIPPMVSTVQLERNIAPQPKHKRKEVVPYVPCHLRQPLAPCLSSPGKLLSSIVQLSPGGSQRILLKIPCSTVCESTPRAKAEKRPYDLSASWCSSSVQMYMPKRTTYKGENLIKDNDILSGFLKNNGGYLDESDDEGDEDDGNFSSIFIRTSSGSSINSGDQFDKSRQYHWNRVRKPAST